MPIIGRGASRTTDRPRFEKIGDIRKGDKKELHPGKLPPELPYFRFESPYPEVVREFQSIYGTQPKEITIFLAPSENPLSDVWEAWCEAYNAGAMLHRCNGKTMYRWLEQEKLPSGKIRTVYHDGQKPCRAQDHVSQKNPDGIPERDQVGRLYAIIAKQMPNGSFIPAFGELGRIGVVTVHTGGTWDINQIEETLKKVGATYGVYYDNNGEEHQYAIPFQLVRIPRMVSTEDWKDPSKRKRVEKIMCELNIHPAYKADRFSQLWLSETPARPPLAAGLPQAALPAPTYNAPALPEPKAQAPKVTVIDDAGSYEPPSFEAPAPPTDPYDTEGVASKLWPGMVATVKEKVAVAIKAGQMKASWSEFVRQRDIDLNAEAGKEHIHLTAHVKAAWPGKEPFVKKAFDELTAGHVQPEPYKIIAAVARLGDEPEEQAVAMILAEHA